MPRGLNWIAAPLAVLAAACGSSTEPRIQHTYSIAFQEDSAQHYDPFACSPPATYCTAWSPVSDQFAGSLRADTGATHVLTLHNTTDDPAFRFIGLTFDSVAVLSLGRDMMTCNLMTLRVALAGGMLRGTWTEQLDCHGRSRTGSLTGTEDR
jgi:hypothetical protein